jgi:hypothetical protein
MLHENAGEHSDAVFGGHSFVAVNLTRSMPLLANRLKINSEGFPTRPRASNQRNIRSVLSILVLMVTRGDSGRLRCMASGNGHSAFDLRRRERFHHFAKPVRKGPAAVKGTLSPSRHLLIPSRIRLSPEPSFELISLSIPNEAGLSKIIMNFGNLKIHAFRIPSIRGYSELGQQDNASIHGK